MEPSSSNRTDSSLAPTNIEDSSQTPKNIVMRKKIPQNRDPDLIHRQDLDTWPHLACSPHPEVCHQRGVTR
eukprot:scaffold3667_cov180-Amphora_coffeaeformis.AAC.9